ncbi:uncharacterized protein ISCGN_005693, partial [Ixodes scapularis]
DGAGRRRAAQHFRLRRRAHTLANNPGTLQQRINIVAALSSRLRLRLNPAKCRTLHLSGQHPVGTRPTRFLIEREPVPTIGDFVGHAFLGKPVGYLALHDDATISDAVDLGKRLLNSVLAPWQRLDINTPHTLSECFLNTS